MAINLKDIYPGQVDESDPVGYPGGAAQDDLVEGDGFGTPLQKTWVNDVWGFLQALLSAANLTATGTPDKVGASQYLTAVGWTAEGARATFNVKHPKFGAVGSGLVNDSTAITDAIAAAAAAGGGDVYAPPGAYRFDNGISLPRTVSLFGHPNGTTFLLNHATADFVTFTTGTNTSARCIISGIGFGALVANTGKVFTDAGSGSRRVLVHNCTVGDDDANLKGSLCYLTGASSVRFLDCELHVNSTSYGLLSGHVGATLEIEGGRIVCPATYASYLVYFSLGGGSVKTTFDFTAHGSGSDPVAVSVSSGPTTPVAIVGNRFLGAGGPTKFALRSDSNTSIVCDGNAYYGVNRFGVLGQLQPGSRLDLYPDSNVSLVGSSYTVSTGVRSTAIRFGVGSTAPTITLPPILFAGQELDLTIFNASGGPLGFSLANYGFKATQPTITSSGGVSARFVAGDPDATGTLVWVQIGGWAQISA